MKMQLEHELARNGNGGTGIMSPCAASSRRCSLPYRCSSRAPRGPKKPKPLRSISRCAFEIIAPRPALYCYGPFCAPRPLASALFLKSLGGSAKSVVDYLCTPAKVGTVNYRVGLVSAIGGPALGLRVRW